jgi:hypothetical protein
MGRPTNASKLALASQQKGLLDQTDQQTLTDVPLSFVESQGIQLGHEIANVQNNVAAIALTYVQNHGNDPRYQTGFQQISQLFQNSQQRLAQVVQSVNSDTQARLADSAIVNQFFPEVQNGTESAE